MTIDYKKLTVEEIRMMILKESNGFLTEADVDNIKGKAAVIEAHQKMTQVIDQGLVTGEPITREALLDEPEKEEVPVPKYTDVGWEDFLLSQLQPNEMDNGYPKVNGLRRLAETFLGEIISSGPVEVKSLGDHNETGKAVVTFQVTIAWTRDVALGLLDIEGGNEVVNREYRAVASAWRGNTDDMYAVYPEAIAESRAEARALRRALRISKVSSDELTKKNTALVTSETMDTTVNMDRITDTQKKVIETMCNRLQIDILKFINNGSKQYGDNIDAVGRETASKMIQALNDYQNTSDGSVTVPEHLKVK